MFFDHSSISFSSWLGCPTVSHWGPCGCWHPVTKWLGHLVILLSHVHLLPLFFRLFTREHLLIDGSVKGQYITLWGWNIEGCTELREDVYIFNALKLNKSCVFHMSLLMFLTNKETRHIETNIMLDFQDECFG